MKRELCIVWMLLIANLQATLCYQIQIQLNTAESSNMWNRISIWLICLFFECRGLTLANNTAKYRRMNEWMNEGTNEWMNQRTNLPTFADMCVHYGIKLSLKYGNINMLTFLCLCPEGTAAGVGEAASGPVEDRFRGELLFVAIHWHVLQYCDENVQVTFVDRMFSGVVVQNNFRWISFPSAWKK